MPLPVIINLCICIPICAIFAVFFYKKNLAYIYLKTLSSISFMVLGMLCLYNFIISNHDTITPNTLAGVFIIFLGLIMCMVGDIILALPKLPDSKGGSIPIIVGGASIFGLGHILYSTALIILMGFNCYVLLLCIPLALFYTFANKLFGKLDYKKLLPGILAYSFVESLSLALCIVSIVANGANTFKLLLLFGYILFFVSDMVLMHNYFGKKKRAISIATHSTYYPAQILIALSLLFF